MRSLAFKLIPWESFLKLIILSKMAKNNFFEKCVLELCRTTMINPWQIERSVFFLVDHNRQTRIYRLVAGQPDERCFRYHYKIFRGEFHNNINFPDAKCISTTENTADVWIWFINNISVSSLAGNAENKQTKQSQGWSWFSFSYF